MSRYIDAELFCKNLMMQVYFAGDEDFAKAFVNRRIAKSNQQEDIEDEDYT